MTRKNTEAAAEELFGQSRKRERRLTETTAGKAAELLGQSRKRERRTSEKRKNIWMEVKII